MLLNSHILPTPLLLFCALWMITDAVTAQDVLADAPGRNQTALAQQKALVGTAMHVAPGADEDIPHRDSKAALRGIFELRAPDELSILRHAVLNDSLRVDRYQRAFHGIPVEHGHYVVLSVNGRVRSMYAEHYILDDIDIQPRLSEEEALAFALVQIDADMYAWQATHALARHPGLEDGMRERLQKIAGEEYPSGRLVIVRDFNEDSVRCDLAWRFEIEGVIPLFRDRVYINAHDGRVMLRDPQIKHGTGETRYAGVRTFPTSLFNSMGVDTFQLRGVDPVSGVLCETRNVNGFGGLPLSLAAVYALSTPILDGDQPDPCLTDGAATVAETGDDNWLQVEHRKALFDTLPPPDISCCTTYTPHPGTCNEIQNDDIALDAQWGASIVARYWKSRHGWNSFDNQGADIISFVHYGDAYNNAFWNGTYMTYGDGSSQKETPDPNGDFGPFTSLDICAHEIGHAICSNTSDLVYQKESGAMNESFSDIWAAAIEQFVLDSIDATLNYDPYGIGEQVDDRDEGLPPGDPGAYAIRWMDDPQACLNPDTYNGTYYFPTEGPICPAPNLATDYCGVHLNSSVMNKWFYLLTTGSGQAFSPGSCLAGMKAAADDGVNDLGNAYEVSGIGFASAEQITFFAETLLTPNALFTDMRAASIDAARVLFGLCSFEEEQTTNAWYAVGVGDSLGTCSPAIVFGDFNPAAVSETSEEVGCSASKAVALTLHSYMANQTISFVTSGNAVVGEDFDLDSTTMTFNGSETRTLQVIIYDDKVIESAPDTVVIAFSNGGFADTTMLVILDDDVIPAVGDTVTLVTETFTNDSIPTGWQQFAINIESGNHWEFNGSGNVAGKAYIATPGSPTAAYDPTAFTNVRLVSPLLDARGRSNVEISFDWIAGGEADAVEPTVIFDYGTFQLSSDGLQWTDITNFVGTAGGSVPDSGTYVQMHPELDNQQFYLGFRWYNDGLIGSSFSFAIDNVVVTAEDMDVESDPGDSMEAIVPAGTPIAFVSTSDNELIGILDAAHTPLGCTELRIAENDTNAIVMASVCDQRSSKVLELMSSANDSVVLTMFYKSSELNGWTDPADLNLLAVNGADIDDFSAGFQIIPNHQLTISEGDEYVSYTFGTTSAHRTYALTDRSPNPVVRTVLSTENDGPRSLRYMVEMACPADTIRFTSNLSGDTIRLTGPEILVDKDLVILGLGTDSLFISGENNARIFRIDSSHTVIMHDLTCLHGEAAGNGDAILNHGMLILKNVALRQDPP
ncbi:MAG: M4 family metallopeptidase [Saprospiraceae bacterium]|nr:M4 family metallopeptidase [Saprospiraceae bacterium]